MRTMVLEYESLQNWVMIGLNVGKYSTLFHTWSIWDFISLEGTVTGMIVNPPCHESPDFAATVLAQGVSHENPQEFSGLNASR